MTTDPASTVDTYTSSAPPPPAREWGLCWLSGDFAGTTLPLDFGEQAELLLGRDEECFIHLPMSDISRRHATLRLTESGAALSVTDLGSRNGTRVNGQAVQSSPLSRNDVVRLGGCVFSVVASHQSFIDVAPELAAGPTFQRALAPLAQAARSDLPIVLEGETGTGKEVVTRAIHGWSKRSGPLIAVNCAALPQGLAEAELFGYRRGAFTGADRPSLGFLRSAEAGTLLLDEVSDLPLGIQAKLLRALEQREVQPLGETRPVPFNARIVVAGQQSLLDAVRRQAFRADLLARLNGYTLQLPALRERREEIIPLLRRFLTPLRADGAPRFEPEFVERLALHDWPFNVRELMLLARRIAVLHGSEGSLRMEHLPPEMAGAVSGASRRAALTSAVQSAEPPSEAPAKDLDALLEALREVGGNVTRAAAQLGITRQRAYRLMEGSSVDLAELSGKKRPRRPAR